MAKIALKIVFKLKRFSHKIPANATPGYGWDEATQVLFGSCKGPRCLSVYCLTRVVLMKHSPANIQISTVRYKAFYEVLGEASAILNVLMQRPAQSQWVPRSKESDPPP